MPADRMVILTREVADNAALAQALSKRGLNVVEVPCLATRVRSVQLSGVGGFGVEHFAAIAFTSRRAVDAVAQDASSLQAYGGLLAAVGQGTGEAIARQLRREPEIVSNEGTGESLAALLAVQLPAGAPILHLRGDKTTGTLQRGLSAAGFPLHEEVVYENFAPPIQRLEGVPEGTLAVFASPSAARRFFAANEHLLTLVIPVAIGPTTQAALQSLGTRTPALAPRPNVEALLECIFEITGR
jgi:uroporphyrinogen-III synthase